MEILRSIKDVTNKVLETARLDGAIRSSLEAELMLKTNSQNLTNLLLSKNLHEPDITGEGVDFGLADLFIVSKVTVREEEEGVRDGAESDCCYSLSEEVDCWDGEAVEVEAQVRRASRSGTRHKCPRCWKWTSTSEDALCSRCQFVVNSEKSKCIQLP